MESDVLMVEGDVVICSGRLKASRLQKLWMLLGARGALFEFPDKALDWLARRLLNASMRSETGLWNTER
jgi:hypothetical protein